MESSTESYRYCCLCNARGVNALLMSEIFDSDDDTVVTPVPHVLDAEIEIVEDDAFEVQPKTRDERKVPLFTWPAHQGRRPR